MSSETKQDIQKSINPENAPLIRTTSAPEAKLFAASTSKAKNKLTVLIGHNNTFNSSNQPLAELSYNDGDIENKKTYTEFQNKMFDREMDIEADLSDMSANSRYQSAENLNVEMDTTGDLEDLPKIEYTPSQNHCDKIENLSNNVNSSQKLCPAMCCKSVNAQSCLHPKIFFRDKSRSVDFVLVWDAFEADAVTPDAYAKRRIFEENLMNEGLEIEYEPQEENGLNFVKVHAPQEVLRRYSEILKLRMPMKEGDLKHSGSMRNLLYTEWAALAKWFRYQPLDYVKEYFGVKIALYFAWLGFYTNILIPPAIVGLICFIYSIATLYSNKPSEDICNLNLGMKMCPLCDDWCDYFDLKETCVHARISYLFDNGTTVFFAVFMSFWGALFLEMWKRYSAEITHRWDLTGFDVQEEHPRPEYLARLAHVRKKQMNVITNAMEPHVPFWKIRLPMTIFSFSVVLLLVTLALATVVAIVLYRMSVRVALKVHAHRFDDSTATLFTTCTAACLNLFFIVIFNRIYTYLAEYLTEIELLRTQTEFDDSLTLKIYLLQFVNYYASIFYIAFFKGKFIGSPNKFTKIMKYRQEECGPGGCLLELSLQLAIIMIGKQAMNTVLEMLFPLFFKWLNTLKVKTGLSEEKRSCKERQPQWLKDFKLVEWGPRSLFPEYLEMVLQYGFVTIFVAAFPLAPLFALLNNILEMRLDAQKLLTFYRRPVTQRVKDIGIWYRILDSIGKLSVVTNGFIIAFTSTFIPKLVYTVAVSENQTLDGFLNNSLSYFKTTDFQIGSVPVNNSQEYCRYTDYRTPPWDQHKYERTTLYWTILAARLAFVVIFENVVVLVMIIVKWCIPDMSGALRDQIRRETYVTNEIIINQETLRAHNAQFLRPTTSSRTMEKLKNINECPATPEQWDRVISKSLSGSEFDLLVHSDDKVNSPSSI